MTKFQLFFHHTFRFIWNAIFVISYPIMATFGMLFIGMTYVFSAISKMLTRWRPSPSVLEKIPADWVPVNRLIERKIHKQILFGPVCYRIRRTDGIPTVLEDHIFGQKTKFIEEGIILERWNATELKNLPDFDICLYDPDEDKLTFLAQIKCFDWHLAHREENKLLFKWFDGTQGGEVNVAL